MIRTASLAAALAILAATPGVARAATQNTAPCWRWDGSAYHARLQDKPRRCTLGGNNGAEQVDVLKMKWRSWGGGDATGRGVSVANMGSRASVRVKLYRRARVTGNVFRFTRARFNFDGLGWGRPLVLKIH